MEDAGLKPSATSSGSPSSEIVNLKSNAARAVVRHARHSKASSWPKNLFLIPAPFRKETRKQILRRHSPPRNNGADGAPVRGFAGGAPHRRVSRRRPHLAIMA